VTANCAHFDFKLIADEPAVSCVPDSCDNSAMTTPLPMRYFGGIATIDLTLLFNSSG
jgi:hypothetical protein